jgi:alcohol dehydrogenase class IV
MCKGSNLAGKAVGISRTASCHALSYPITAKLNINHGHSVSTIMSKMLLFNSEFNSPLLEVFETHDSTEIKKRFDEIVKNVGIIYPDLNDIIDFVIENVNEERLKNNPKILTPQKIRDILK